MRSTEASPIDPGTSRSSRPTRRRGRTGRRSSFTGPGDRRAAGPGAHRGELHVGAMQAFADAGFKEVSSPSGRRAVMRVDFDR
ncbi:MAG TPA: hypothetical protein VH594_22185 [Trebonia sp.]